MKKAYFFLLIAVCIMLFSIDVSAQVQIDKDLQMIGTAGNKDIIGAETVDVSIGYLVGGTATTGRYLRGNGTHFVSSPLLAGDLSGTLSNAQLANSSLTVAAGTGMSGGGSVSLGGSVTLNNAGVTSLTGTANRVTVSASTGAVTISAPQNIHTAATPTFAGMTLSGLAANSGVYTNASKVLTTTAPATGTLGFWERTSGALSPATLGDNVGLGTASPTERLHLASNGSVRIRLEADMNNSGEGDQPQILFSQDGDAVAGLVGYSGSTNHMRIENNYASTDADIDLITQGTIRMTVDGNGLIGVATTAPLSDLDIAQSGGSASAQQTGGINLRNAQYQWRIYNSNDFVRFNYSNDNGSTYTAKAYINSSNGAWTTVSDASMKKNVTPLSSVLAGVLKLNPVEYLYIDNAEGTSKSMGFLAQEAQEVFPNTVSHEKEESLLGIDYASFGVIAIKAIQEQQKIIEEGNRERAELRNAIDDLQKTVEELKGKIK